MTEKIKKIEIKRRKNEQGTTNNYTKVLHYNSMNMIVKGSYLD